MSVNKNELFSNLFKNFLSVNNETEAIIVSDQEGFVIAGEKRSDLDLEIISFLTAVVNPVLERIRNEFSFQKFGTANFDTENHRLLFISVNENTTLSLVIEMMAWVDRVAPYAYLLAEKVAQILGAEEQDIIQVDIPKFQYEIDFTKHKERVEEQIYQDPIAQGKDYTFKFIIIGDHEVGKTSLVRRFVDKQFKETYRATIGLNILSHNFEAFGNKVNINLWDIGAQHYFKRFRKTYYDGAEACFLVFDITKRESFDNAKNWHNELREFIQNKDIPVIIVGNKIDMEDKRAVTYEEGAALAKELSDLSEYYEKSALSQFSDLSKVSSQIDTKIAYIETSAKTGDRVDEAFNLITYHYMRKSSEFEELQYKEDIIKEITGILEDHKSLTVTFLCYDPMWSPGMQILTEIEELGQFSRDKVKTKEKIYTYSNGLIVKNYSLDSFKVEDSDCVFCLFDARNKNQMDPEWNQIAGKVWEKLKENKVLSIGFRTDENADLTKLSDDFDIHNQINDKFLSVFFFKLESNYRLEVYKELAKMFKSIHELIYSI